MGSVFNEGTANHRMHGSGGGQSILKSMSPPATRDAGRSRSYVYTHSEGQGVFRLAVFTLAVHMLCPVLYLALFEQYVGDDIIWHPRNVIVYNAFVTSMIVCPILLTVLMLYARWRRQRLRTEGIFQVWGLDMIYTLVIFAWMLTPAVY